MTEFSVVIPTYNREKTIIRAIESVLQQTYHDVEVVVVDDCSKDNTVQIVKGQYSSDTRVLLYKQPQNQGACAARNKGVELCHGKYVAFLDSDDLWMPDKLEKQNV